jgi:hypothetical protein
MRGLFRQCVFGARRKSPHEEPPIDDTGKCRGTYEGAASGMAIPFFGDVISDGRSLRSQESDGPI